jgi:hypothetical protein
MPGMRRREFITLLGGGVAFERAHQVVMQLLDRLARLRSLGLETGRTSL